MEAPLNIAHTNQTYSFVWSVHQSEKFIHRLRESWTEQYYSTKSLFISPFLSMTSQHAIVVYFMNRRQVCRCKGIYFPVLFASEVFPGTHCMCVDFMCACYLPLVDQRLKLEKRFCYLRVALIWGKAGNWDCAVTVHLNSHVPLITWKIIEAKYELGHGDCNLQ